MKKTALSNVPNTYLFTWNSKYWPIEKLIPKIDEVEAIGKTIDVWGIASHTKVNIGDRVFFNRVRSQIKGIFASGTVISKPFPFVNYKGKTVPGVEIEFDVFLNPDKGQILEIDRVIANTPFFRWSPQSSGIQISQNVVKALEILWANYLIEKNLLVTSEVIEKTIIEGTTHQLTQTVYERNRYARIVCLKHHGYSCVVCDFNFKDRYGEIGEGYIHVHHLKQLSIVKESMIDPVKDLRPVCPNCHAMLHKVNPPYTLEELKQLLQSNKK
jgi:5-methylcytosine-specific restriction protein A